MSFHTSKGFAQTWYLALTWYFLRLSSLRTHFEPWKAVGTQRSDSLAAQYHVAGRPAQQTAVLAKSTKFKHGTKLGRSLCYTSTYTARKLFSGRSHSSPVKLRLWTTQRRKGV